CSCTEGQAELASTHGALVRKAGAHRKSGIRDRPRSRIAHPIREVLQGPSISRGLELRSFCAPGLAAIGGFSDGDDDVLWQEVSWKIVRRRAMKLDQDRLLRKLYAGAAALVR